MDFHGAVTAVDALHLNEGPLHFGLIGEANETVSPRLSRHSVRHDFGSFARWEPSLEKRDEYVLVNLGPKIADKDRVLRTAILTVICQIQVHDAKGQSKERRPSGTLRLASEWDEGRSKWIQAHDGQELWSQA